MEHWRRYLESERELAPNTVKLYTRYIESLARETGEPTALKVEDLRAWLHGKSGSAGTVGNRIAALKSFYQFLYRTGARADDPSSQLVAPKKRASPPKPVDDLEEVLTKLDELDRKANQEGVIPRRVGESRDMAIFLAETGLRISDAVSCDWPVPCPSEVAIRVGRRKESLLVSEAAREAWERLDGRWPVGARATQRRFEKAGFNPHQLRHWHRAFKRPMPGSRDSHLRSARGPSSDNALQALLNSYDETDRELLKDFLSKLLTALDGKDSPGSP
jgi:integrase